MGESRAPRSSTIVSVSSSNQEPASSHGCASWTSIRRQFKNNHFTEMCSGSEAGSYLRLLDSFISQLKAQGPSRTCNESKEEEEEEDSGPGDTQRSLTVVRRSAGAPGSRRCGQGTSTSQKFAAVPRRARVEGS